MAKKLVVFTGAGMSADSGLSTFRDADGLWDKYKIEDVCTPEALQRNPALVNEFYNIRRKELLSAKPNAGHYAIADLEKYYDVEVITQNIDDLHERAGSTHVTHLHGELRKVRSSIDENLIYDVDGWEVKIGDKCEKGSQLRPFVVFFGEPVPMFEKAIEITSKAEILVVVGTSLNVYPAASLLYYADKKIPVYVVDPHIPDIRNISNPLVTIPKRAAVGMPELRDRLIAETKK